MGFLLSNLRVRFLLLVLLAMTPAVGLLYFTASEQRDDAVAAARGEARRLANLAAADHGRLIESTRQLLIVLARLPEVRAGNPDACGALLADLRNQFPLYANLGVIAPDGLLVCSAVPTTGAIDLSERSYFREAIETDSFAVGKYQIGLVTDRPSLNCGYPVHDEAGRVLGVVFAAIALEELAQFAADAQLPPGAVLTVYDGSGQILVRHPDSGDLIGTSALGTPVVATALAQPAGLTMTEVIDDEDPEGEDFLFAFAPLRGAVPGAAYLSIAFPRTYATEAADDTFSRNLTRLGLVVLVILVAAWVGGDLLVRRDSAEINKELVRRLYDSFDTGGVDLLDEVVATDFVDHDPIPGQAPGLAGLKQAVGLFRAAFPDGTMTVEHLTAERDRVVAHVNLSGTQMGEFAGVPPTGRSVTADGIETYRVAGGKIVEGWSRFGPLLVAEPGTTAADFPRQADAMRPRRPIARTIAWLQSGLRGRRSDEPGTDSANRQPGDSEDGSPHR